MSNIITEINIVDPKLKSGRAIDADRLRVANHRIHLVGTMASRMMFAMLEGDSNNAVVTLVPQEVRKFYVQWAAVKREFQFALDHNDGPMTQVEENLAILVPSGNEIQRVVNEKLKRVIRELKRFAMVLAGSDAAGLQGVVGNTTINDVQTMFKIVDDAMALYLGTGKDINDTGIDMPDFPQLGVTVPDLDNDESQLQEGSADATEKGYADVKDTASVSGGTGSGANTASSGANNLPR